MNRTEQNRTEQNRTELKDYLMNYKNCRSRVYTV